jgi:hypothetical protein
LVCRRGDHQLRLVQSLPKSGDSRSALGVVGAEVENGIVVEVHAVGSELGQLADGRSAGIGGRTAEPKTSTPCQPTVQMPKEK